MAPPAAQSAADGAALSAATAYTSPLVVRFALQGSAFTRVALRDMTCIRLVCSCFFPLTQSLDKTVSAKWRYGHCIVLDSWLNALL